ncbi:MAG: arsenate reductase ArsC [Methanomicrobiales archaeon]|nr:arsenate reductase ArsC [Methanomicrobiales archaeon]
MAEGYMTARFGDQYEAFGAGTRASTVSQYASQVMREIGIDISLQKSKSLEVFSGKEMDLVVILCDEKGGTCPHFPWAKESIHVEFTDPGEFTGAEEEVRVRFRGLRDEIINWIDRYFGSVPVGK